jgi:hypothetical protein
VGAGRAWTSPEADFGHFPTLAYMVLTAVKNRLRSRAWTRHGPTPAADFSHSPALAPMVFEAEVAALALLYEVDDGAVVGILADRTVKNICTADLHQLRDPLGGTLAILRLWRRVQF